MPKNPILSYWRNSLIDSERAKLDIHRITGEESIKIHQTEYQSGKVVLQAATDKLIAAYRQAVGGDRKSSVDAIPVLIYPQVYKAEDPNTKLSTIIPLCYPAKLSKTGVLVPTDDLPWIPRQYLSPIENGTFTIGAVEDVESYYDTNPFNGINWDEYLTYGAELLANVSTNAFGTGQYTTEGSTYALLPLVYIVADTTEQLGACKTLVALYDAIQALPHMPALTQRYVSLKDEHPLEPLSKMDQVLAGKRHYGQMQADFPLGESQRTALRQHTYVENDSTIIAVTGPPGTGKTTFIQSIVATEWVRSAFEEREHPPIIFIASTNNQAVTNAIDSFCNIKRDETTLSCRWLPLGNTYGLYCASASSDKKDYLTVSDLPGKVENLTFFTEAKQLFLTRFSQHFRSSEKSLENARNRLLEEIRKKSSYLGIFESITKIHQDSKATSNEALRRRQQEEIKRTERAKSVFAPLARSWEEHCASTPWIMVLLEFLSPVSLARRKMAAIQLDEMFAGALHLMNKDQQTKLKRLKDSLATEEKYPASQWHPSIKQFLTELISQSEEEYRCATSTGLVSEIDLNDLADTREHVRKVLEELGTTESLLDKHLDTTIRFELFNLATHYWEAMWLLEIESLLRNKAALPELGKSPDNLMRRWRRYAKLTPLMVSTLHMLPKHLCGWKAAKGGFKAEPLFGFVDLLIIDEAGQVAPEIAAPATALAKAMIVIGDTKQIEPVQTLPKAIDKANMRRHTPEYADKYNLMGCVNKGIASASGSAMHIAQRISDFPPVMLTEHRRCVPSIISYCNRLAYNGSLVPLRSERQVRCFPAWSHVQVGGKAVRSGGSWSNREEAEAVAEWVFDAVGRINEFYKESISKTVGVVTPFARQATLIRHLLTEKGIPRVTVGTIHAFQGAERDIIVFSPVYDAKCGEPRFFFDQNVNMLNVAVSRARDSFVVVGDSGIFKKGNSPSGQLAHVLFPDVSE